MTYPPPARDVVFLDCETNGRYVERGHVAWDVAAWNLTTGHRVQFFVHIPDMSRFLGTAEPIALRVSRFLDRYPLDGPCPGHEDTAAGLDALRDVLDGGRDLTSAAWHDHPRPVLVGSKPTFDMGFIGSLAQRYGHPDPNESDHLPWWHHHPIDLGAYAAGVLGIEPGTSSLSAESVARLCGIEPGGHTAEGDVTSGGACFLTLREVARRGAGPDLTIYMPPAAHLADLVAEGFVADLLRPTAPVA